MKKFHLYLIALVIGIISCTKTDTPDSETPIDLSSLTPEVTSKGMPTGSVYTQQVGAAGGNVQSPDGKISIDIPAGALSANTAIGIQPITNEAPMGAGNAYRLTPEGAVFARPVTITIKYGGDMKPGLSWIVTQKADGSWLGDRNTQTDETTKTLSVKTTHFSDWGTGKLIDFRLAPKNTVLKVKGQVQLYVNGFKKMEPAGDDELVPLAPLYKKNADDDALAPLPVLLAEKMEQLNNYKLDFKEWRLSGQGNLKPAGSRATYTAPDKIPSPNPVTVSVNINATNNGKTTKLILLSNIKIVDADLYLLLTVDGTTYEYYQYGFNGSVPPDPNNLSIANCGIDDNLLSVAGTHVQNNSNMVSSFALSVSNPAEGTVTLKCLLNNGQDDAQFTLGSQQAVYDMNQIIRTPIPGPGCDDAAKCANMTITFTTYENKWNGKVTGTFSGILYEDKPGFSDECKSTIAHNITGEFNLVRAN
ncbi:hypothetical protein [Niabella drilacis]|uniref:ZU5 domain-containing protein n=1 Tax=Niabella drilacis (strain DSM 25811 / CCM 8410 / CCUG 62505 / LMG 26954 / E90) TaxID=1285928 RepID=A0A1G6MSR4_NIADE|nr:hypothetical protein [Niabella drilacis]SDC58603.1 hypothetical protein SAMN04487894_10325 [Niabella drilacis]